MAYGMTGGSFTGSGLGGGEIAARLAADQQRKKTEADAQVEQDRLRRIEQENLAMQAQRLALDKAYSLSGDSRNPLTTSGVDMQVSNYGDVGYGSASRGGRGGSGGGDAYGDAMDTTALEALYQKYSPSPITVPPQVSAPTPPSRAAGTSQAFARAKDLSSRQGAAAMKALRDTMTRRGMSDSGLESELDKDILTDMARFNTDAAFQSDLTDDARAWDAMQMGFQGALSQRTNDLGVRLQERGQDIDRTAPLLALLSRRY